MSAFLEIPQEACDIKQARKAAENCEYTKNDTDNYAHCIKSSLNAQQSFEPCTTSGGKRRKTIKKTKKSQKKSHKKRRRTRAKKPKNKSRR
jgi:hypothetical protein